MERSGLFAYGSLLFPEVLEVLLGRVPERSPATVPGWRVAALRGRAYPGLVPGTGPAAGLLVTGLDAAEWRLIDTFEGPEYEPRPLALGGGGSAWAYVYTVSANVAPHDWDRTRFATGELAAFAARCQLWRRRYDPR